MPPRSQPFASTAELEHAFADGLTSMLATHDGLGVYVLVLANAAFDAALWARLGPALSARHAAHAATLASVLRQGRQPDDPDDDVLVFLKLHMTGFASVGTLERRRIGPWEAMFNPIRALRPPRGSGTRFDGLLRPFDPAGFHFNKPFLAKEVLWEGELAGMPVRALYNKFPFARLHGLLVPDPGRQSPQLLDPERHAWAWAACARSELPDLCLGYNSYGAGASVNHLHFQSFVRSHPLAVQDPRFSHNGGTQPYPLPCKRFHDPDAAWAEIEVLHRRNTPYNLVYSRERLHLVARCPQDSSRLSDQSRGYGWSEMAGAVTLFSRDAFETLDGDAFAAELARFAP